MSDRIDDLLRLDNEENNKNTADFSKSLKKSMNKQIYKRAIVTVICFSLIVTALYFGASKLLDMAYYNPTEEKGLSKVYDEYHRDDFDFLFCEYVGLVLPGYRIYHGNEDNKNSMGFGKYKYSYGIFKGLDNINVCESNSEVIIDRNHWEMGENSVGIYNTMDRFHTNLYSEYDYCSGPDRISEDKEMVEEIRKLPDSAILLANVSFEHEKTADLAVDFMRKHSDSSVEWIAVKDSNVIDMGSTTGISFSTLGSYYDLSEEAKEKYPNLVVVGSYFTDSDNGELLGGEELTNTYLSTLKLLLNHKEFVEVINLCDYSVEQMQAQYRSVSENGLWVTGMQMVVTKQALLDMIDNNEIQYLTIDDVKLSTLSKQ